MEEIPLSSRLSLSWHINLLLPSDSNHQLSWSQAFGLGLELHHWLCWVSSLQTGDRELLGYMCLSLIGFVSLENLCKYIPVTGDVLICSSNETTHLIQSPFRKDVL